MREEEPRTVTDSTAVVTAELIPQVQIAKAYPRALATVTSRAIRLATIDQETAEGCFYTLKRKDKRTGEIKKIQGPSIRLAEIMAHTFGNIAWGGRTIREEAGAVVCQGAAHDLEANNRVTTEVSRRITTSEGRRYSEDMVTVTTMAAIAICKRNSVLGVIPGYLWKPVYEAAVDKAVGDASTLADRRQKMVAKFAQMGVGVEKILAYAERSKLDEITLEDLQDLIGAFSSIREGEQTVDEVFGLKPEMPTEPLSKAEAAAQAPSPAPQEPVQPHPDRLEAPPAAPPTEPEPPPAAAASPKGKIPDDRSTLLRMITNIQDQYKIQAATREMLWKKYVGRSEPDKAPIGKLQQLLMNLQGIAAQRTVV